jgi:hypothetical protein
MTGISDIFKVPPRAAVHLSSWVLLALQRVLPSPMARILAPLKRFVVISSSARVRCPQPSLPNPRPTLELRREAHAGASSPPSAPPVDLAKPSSAIPLRWGLLLPITSRGMEGEACWQGLEAMASSLLATISADKCAHTQVHVGIDMKDPVYDTPDARQRIEALFAGLGAVAFYALPP